MFNFEWLQNINFHENQISQQSDERYFNRNTLVVFGLSGLFFSLFVTCGVLKKVVYDSPTTTLNNLIILDCLIKLKCVVFIPLKLGLVSNHSLCSLRSAFAYFINFSDRMISLSIAIIRYSLANHPEKFMTKWKRNVFHKRLFAGMLAVLLTLTFGAFIYRYE